MAYKVRTKPVALSVTESLNQRKSPSPDDKKYYLNQLKGFEGELKFDTYLEKLKCDCLVLNDLQLKHDHKEFQIDTLILAGDTLYLFEIKNYSGNYDYGEEHFIAKSDFKIDNPVFQIRRSKTLLYSLVRKLGYRYSVKAFVVFVNPEFQLYHLPRETPFIFANQIPRHFQMLENKRTTVTEQNRKLAGELCQLHIKNYRPKNLPSYEWSELTKGIFCPECFSFEHMDTRKNRVCGECGYKELITESILRSCVEYRILFPNQRMTINDIYEWCGGVYDKQRIRRVLKKYYYMEYYRNGTYYIEIE